MNKSMQTKFDDDALGKLPLIRSILQTADSFEANQIRCYTLREICNSLIPLDQMTDNQKQNFSKSLLEIYREKKWI